MDKSDDNFVFVDFDGEYFVYDALGEIETKEFTKQERLSAFAYAQQCADKLGCSWGNNN